MPSSPLVQVDPSSVDAAGVSLSTAPASANPRTGTAYNLTTLAGAQPIWFHPMYDGRYLMINARVWTGATPIGGIPGGYSAYTESTAPTWTVLDGPTGMTRTPAGQYDQIPMLTSATNAVVTAAASRPPATLYLLTSINSGTGAVLQRFAINPNEAVALTHEEVLPTWGTLVFNKGLQYATPYLVVYGTDVNQHVYCARKLWARVGTNTNTSTTPQIHAGVIGLQAGWEYYNGTGFTSDLTELAPVLTAAGVPLTTTGPMSFATYNALDVATTVGTGTTPTGTFWSSRSGRPWTADTASIALGSTTDGSYLGGGIQLQPQLSANSGTGLVYAASTRTVVTGGYSLHTFWDILPVRG